MRKTVLIITYCCKRSHIPTLLCVYMRNIRFSQFATSFSSVYIVDFMLSVLGWSKGNSKVKPPTSKDIK